jgi:hypothetical protein
MISCVHQGLPGAGGQVRAGTVDPNPPSTQRVGCGREALRVLSG